MDRDLIRYHDRPTGFELRKARHPVVPTTAPNVPSNFIFVRDRVGFAQMGFGIAGTNGIPALTGTGSTTVGGSGQIDLAGAAPNSLAIRLVSLDHGIKAPTSGPLKFRVLVTAKPILALSLMTNASDAISLPYSLPRPFCLS